MSEEQPQNEQVEHVLDLASRVFRELLPIIPREVLQFDVTMTQLKVVLLLFLNGQMRMSDIASSLQVSLATATGVVDRLVDRSIVARESQANDRRVVLCRLSPKGEDLTDVLWQSARERARELLAAMPPARLLLVNEALQALLDAGTVTRHDLEPGGE